MAAADRSGSAGNVNLRGHVLSFGPTIGWAFGPVNAVARFNVGSHYYVDATNRWGQSLQYSSPTSFRLAAHVRNSRYTYWGLEYVYSRYSQYAYGDATASNLTSNQIVTFNSFGLVFGVEY